MKELLKNMAYLGVGAAFLTKEKLEDLKTELIETGKLSQEEGKKFIDDILTKSNSAKDQLELLVAQTVEKKIKQFNIATRDDIEELRRMVEELQIALNRQAGD